MWGRMLRGVSSVKMTVADFQQQAHALQPLTSVFERRRRLVSVHDCILVSVHDCILDRIGHLACFNILPLSLSRGRSTSLSATAHFSLLLSLSDGSGRISIPHMTATVMDRRGRWLPIMGDGETLKHAHYLRPNDAFMGRGER